MGTPQLATNRTPLESVTDVQLLVRRFYQAVIPDPILGPIFSGFGVDWSVHIPKLVDYWCRVLLGEPGYDGAILGAHRRVHEIDAFRAEHFDRWYSLWVESVDAGWAGPMAERAKRHAARIATSLARRLLDTTWLPPGDARQPFAGTAVEGATR